MGRVTFRVSSSRVNAERLNDGLPRFTAFWLGKNNLERNGARFEIYAKWVDVPYKWEPDLLEHAADSTWHLVGTARWGPDDILTSDIIDIEKAITRSGKVSVEEAEGTPKTE